MRKINFICLFTLVLFIISSHQGFGQQAPQPIAHALGSIDGNVYTNSREAMISSIAKGYKYLEVDIDSTSDGIYIATHDWGHFNTITNHSELKDKKVTFDEFKKRKI